MRNIFITALVVLVLSLGLSIALAESGIIIPVKPLEVLDENFKPVDKSIASATANLPAGPEEGRPTNIVVRADIRPSLYVSLFATEINWDVRKRGVYQVEAIQIAFLEENIQGWKLTDKIFLPVDSIMMTIKGADNLKHGVMINPGMMPQPEIPTYYAASWSNDPRTLKYLDAKSFNQTYPIPPTKGISIWNKINTTGVVTGNYQDDFTVTFSRPL